MQKKVGSNSMKRWIHALAAPALLLTAVATQAQTTFIDTRSLEPGHDTATGWGYPTVTQPFTTGDSEHGYEVSSISGFIATSANTEPVQSQYPEETRPGPLGYLIFLDGVKVGRGEVWPGTTPEFTFQIEPPIQLAPGTTHSISYTLESELERRLGKIAIIVPGTFRSGATATSGWELHPMNEAVRSQPLIALIAIQGNELTMPEPEPEPDPEPDPEPEPEPTSCTLVAPYWTGPTGGFTVKPESGRSSVRATCSGTTTEYAAEDGLVTRRLESTCGTTGLRIEGAAPGGWYWQNGDRNAAVAPLLCAEDLGGSPAVVPGGVTVDVQDNGTWISHDTAGLVGIVPHVAGECSEYVTPYWHGNGGVVIQPAEGERVKLKVKCGRTHSTTTPTPGEDGLVVELVRKSYCTDREGNPNQGQLAVTGAAPGGWYWIAGENNAAVGPLMCADRLGGPSAVRPGGVVYTPTDAGTFLKHRTAELIGVVPHVN